jgi:hypothetical protein
MAAVPNELIGTQSRRDPSSGTADSRAPCVGMTAIYASLVLDTLVARRLLTL